MKIIIDVQTGEQTISYESDYTPDLIPIPVVDQREIDLNRLNEIRDELSAIQARLEVQ